MVILLLALCALLSTFLIIPVFYFATSFSSIYSCTVSAILVFFILLIAIKRLKKAGAFPSIRFFIKSIIIAAGSFLTFFLVISGARIAAFVSLALTIATYLLASRILRRRINELAAEQS